MLTKKVTIVPVEVVVRNVIAGSLAKRLGLKEGEAIQPPIVEWYYKNDALGDPLIADEHVRLLKLATPKQMAEIKGLALKVNSVLQPFFAERGMILVDFKLSPDTCRFWDQATRESMDKDRFRKDLGKIEEAYQEVLKRVCG
jgi:phosphoribosylaminoimidazole-succinocarboxamide synthase